MDLCSTIDSMSTRIESDELSINLNQNMGKSKETFRRTPYVQFSTERHKIRQIRIHYRRHVRRISSKSYLIYQAKPITSLGKLKPGLSRSTATKRILSSGETTIWEFAVNLKPIKWFYLGHIIWAYTYNKRAY